MSPDPLRSVAPCEHWSSIPFSRRPLTTAAGDVLERSGVALVVHPPDGPVAAGVAAVEDRAAVALLGPFRSTDVAETVAATAPGGLALIAPVATWAG